MIEIDLIVCFVFFCAVNVTRLLPSAPFCYFSFFFFAYRRGSTSVRTLRRFFKILLNFFHFFFGLFTLVRTDQSGGRDRYRRPLFQCDARPTESTEAISRLFSFFLSFFIDWLIDLLLTRQWISFLARFAYRPRRRLVRRRSKRKTRWFQKEKNQKKTKNDRPNQWLIKKMNPKEEAPTGSTDD